MLKDFKRFALRGNSVDLAVGVIIGGAFGTIISSLVSDVIMPFVSVLTGGMDLTGAFVSLNGTQYATLADAAAAGAPTLNYGRFLQNVINFLLLALCIFLMVRLIGRLGRKQAEAPAPKPVCPYCKLEVAADASRCPHCTSQLAETGESK
ncbi:MAG: large conductance mechanosensitive channel protein MscL [Clostridia bacterium]|nr:large conductance mechanosensitive channel protein MscL [Clostridia bacterium]